MVNSGIDASWATVVSNESVVCSKCDVLFNRLVFWYCANFYCLADDEMRLLNEPVPFGFHRTKAGQKVSVEDLDKQSDEILQNFISATESFIESEFVFSLS